jgi:hypothetical protein
MVLHSFAAGADGWTPKDREFGDPAERSTATTRIGGNQGCKLGTGGTGYGVVFQVIP